MAGVKFLMNWPLISDLGSTVSSEPCESACWPAIELPAISSTSTVSETLPTLKAIVIPAGWDEALTSLWVVVVKPFPVTTSV